LAFLTNNVFEEDDSIIDRKLNVAMTRARKHLLLFGNPKLLANNITFYKLMEFVRSKHGYFSVPLEDYIAGKVHVPEMEKDLNFSQVTYTLSTKYEEVFNQLVLQHIKHDQRTNWPEVIFGRDMQANLDAIGYGRISFSNQLNIFSSHISPKEQVLIYCYYIMRMHYCSSKNIYESYKSWIEESINANNGRVQFIDFGCGPATCGIAFAELFQGCKEKLQYIGIDISAEMNNIGENFLSNIFGEQLRHRRIAAFGELTRDYWDAVSESPSLIIINLSYVFSNLSSLFTEHLAQMISKVMNKYILNKYVFIVQHSEFDTRLNSYKVFKRIISPYVSVYKKENSIFNYELNSKKRTKEFCYEILESK
jgi:CRISPR/Cas system-associated endoribonuclease Cas2